VIRKEAGPFYRTSSGVRLCWELEEPHGPKGGREGRRGAGRRAAFVVDHPSGEAKNKLRCVLPFFDTILGEEMQPSCRMFQGPVSQRIDPVPRSSRRDQSKCNPRNHGRCQRLNFKITTTTRPKGAEPVPLLFRLLLVGEKSPGF